MHDAEIVLAAALTHPAATNGLPAIMVPVNSVRLPWRIRSVGTVASCVSALSVRVAW